MKRATTCPEEAADREECRSVRRIPAKPDPVPALESPWKLGGLEEFPCRRRVAAEDAGVVLGDDERTRVRREDRVERLLLLLLGPGVDEVAARGVPDGPVAVHVVVVRGEDHRTVR
jgi:hypothetical protein